MSKPYLVTIVTIVQIYCYLMCHLLFFQITFLANLVGIGQVVFKIQQLIPICNFMCTLKQMQSDVYDKNDSNYEPHAVVAMCLQSSAFTATGCSLRASALCAASTAATPGAPTHTTMPQAAVVTAR